MAGYHYIAVILHITTNYTIHIHKTLVRNAPFWGESGEVNRLWSPNLVDLNPQPLNLSKCLARRSICYPLGLRARWKTVNLYYSIENVWLKFWTCLLIVISIWQHKCTTYYWANWTKQKHNLHMHCFNVYLQLFLPQPRTQFNVFISTRI